MLVAVTRRRRGMAVFQGFFVELMVRSLL